jgi:hypothetical protein
VLRLRNALYNSFAKSSHQEAETFCLLEPEPFDYILPVLYCLIFHNSMQRRSCIFFFLGTGFRVAETLHLHYYVTPTRYAISFW